MSDLAQVTTDANHQPSHLGWWIVLAVAIGYAWWILKPTMSHAERLPALQVEGWTNVANLPEEPALENLSGSYVLVDAWATWCPPCRRKMPDLARLYADWQSQGVVFLGITPEPVSELGAIEEFAETVPGFDWPVGYGGNRLLHNLGVKAFPTLMLFDPEGKELWRGHKTQELEIALAQHVGKAG